MIENNKKKKTIRLIMKTKRNRIYLPYDTLCQEIQENIRIITESERKTTEQEKKEAKDWITCFYFLISFHYEYEGFIERNEILVLKKKKYHLLEGNSLKEVYQMKKHHIKMILKRQIHKIKLTY